MNKWRKCLAVIAASAVLASAMPIAAFAEDELEESGNMVENVIEDVDSSNENTEDENSENEKFSDNDTDENISSLDGDVNAGEDTEGDTDEDSESDADEDDEGSENDLCLISSMEDLEALAEEVNNGNDCSGKYFKLTEDIDLSEKYNNTRAGKSWTPIGNSSEHKFAGTLDGDGHKINGLYIKADNTNQGLFGYNAGTIKNLGVVGGTIIKNENDGISDFAGGIAAENSGTIMDCYNTGLVTGSSYVGGIVGKNYGTVTRCYNTGYIDGRVDYIGGIAGYNDTGAAVIDCYNTGNVIGKQYVGGITGENSAAVKFCYSIGDADSIDESGSVGGIAGGNSSVVESCYYLDGKAYFGIGISSDDGAESKTSADFGNMSSFAGWSADIWKMSDSSRRPVLVNNTETNIQPLPTPESSVFANGNGTEESPYIIDSVEMLKAFRDYVNSGSTGKGKYFKLDAKNAKINLTGEWTPIGVYDRDVLGNRKPFSGTFDGGWHTIEGLSINADESDGQGLFAYNAGTIKNLIIGKGSVTGYNDIGSVVGYNSGEIKSCYNNCDVNARDRAGGIVGNNKGIVQECYNTGTISTVWRSCGGIAGDNGNIIINCYNTGDVSGIDYVGGVIGFISFGGKVENCYNIGKVTGEGSDVGGVVGVDQEKDNIISCYYHEDCIETGNNLAVKINQEQIETQDTFKDWDFNGIWIMQDPTDVRPIFGYRPPSPDDEESDDKNPDPDDNQKPDDEEQNSGDEEQEPGDEEQEPGDEGQKPGDEGQEPGDEGQKPSDEEQKPGDEKPKPDNGNQGVGSYVPNVGYPPIPARNETRSDDTSNNDKDDDDVSSAAGIFEDGEFMRNDAAYVIAIIAFAGAAAVIIIRRSGKKQG